jgi:hypothetical protein
MDMDTEWNLARFDWTVLFAARNARMVLEAFSSCLRCLSFSLLLSYFLFAARKAMHSSQVYLS